MHGFVNRSIQLFVQYMHGQKAWLKVTQAAGISFTEFEGMMRYDAYYTPRLLDAMEEVIDRPRAELMEDLGTFIVSNPGFERVRRLLRFGGINFVDFLHSLDDLDDRVRLAISDLDLPKVELRSDGEQEFRLLCATTVPGFGSVMMGVLRAMADDYGALVLLDHEATTGDQEVISIRLIEPEFSSGRTFDLGAYAG